MKVYLILAHLLLSLQLKTSDEQIPLLSSTSSTLRQSQFVDDAEESKPDEGLRQAHSTSPAMIRRGRQSANIPIPSSHAQATADMNKGLSRSPQLEDYFDSPPKSAPRANVPRRALFEPHMRRIEEDFIRQLTFKIRVRKHITEGQCVKITIEGFLRDKRMMKQTVDIEY
jgi:hypothetical protein